MSAVGRWARRGLPLLVFGLLAIIPFSTLSVPGLLRDSVNAPGSLQLLATCLVFAGLAVSYDLLFGHTGLLSFGHALHIAVGVYVTNILITRHGWSLAAAAATALLVGLLAALLLGAVALRVSGIAFAMVTLAFAQAGSILVLRNPGGQTGGEEGLALDRSAIPDAFVGVGNIANLYWFALAFLVVAFAVARWSVNSSPGRVWSAIRENERRVEVLGIAPYGYKLMVYVLAAVLATLGGVVYLLLVGGSTPQTTTSNLTLALLVMVVLGGAGSRWGAVIGGIVYTFLDNRLTSLASSATIEDLPAVLAGPLSQPLFLLGTLFVLIVFFAPGGITGLAARVAGRRGRGDVSRDARRALAVAVGGPQDQQLPDESPQQKETAQ